MVEIENPYQAPSTDVSAAATELERGGEAATRSRRFGSWLIDLACIYGLFFLLGLALALMGNTTWFESLTAIQDRLITMFAMFAYFAVLECSCGRSIGKLATGMRVVNESGEPASFAQVLGRSAARLIPFDQLSIFRDSERCWHDSLSKTKVVRVR